MGAARKILGKGIRVARKAGKMAKTTQSSYFPEKRFQGHIRGLEEGVC
jgi:hypothetical protein